MPTPFVSKRAPIYADVPDEKWNDWRWQLSHRLNTVDEIEKIIALTEKLTKLQQQVNSQNELYARNTSEVVISVSCEIPIAAEFNLNYVVANAGLAVESLKRTLFQFSPVL